MSSTSCDRVFPHQTNREGFFIYRGNAPLSSCAVKRFASLGIVNEKRIAFEAIGEMLTQQFQYIVVRFDLGIQQLPFPFFRIGS